MESLIKQAEKKDNSEKAKKCRLQKKIWKDKKDTLDMLCKSSQDSQLLCNCIDWFTGTPKNVSKKWIEKYRSLFWQKEVQSMLKEMPLLAFYLLCIRLYFWEGKNELQNELQIEDIQLAIVNIGELTEGLIQLLENLHHSSSKKGLFSLRIHQQKGNGSYLYHNYPEYCRENQADYNYEFRILDYSKESIVESFRKKRECADALENFGVRSFFEYTDDFWQEYNKKPENIVHHYGLQIFSAIVSNNEGYFHVVSSSKKQVVSSRDFYSNRTYSAADTKMHIPGTEYVILLPMLKNNVPINPSVDADIQYQFDLKRKYYILPYDLSEAIGQSRTLENKGLEEQELKEEQVNYIKGELMEELVNNENDREELVLLLSACNWGGRNIELYCKALILTLMEWKPKNKQGFYVIIQNCSSNDFISITRMFAIFYGKNLLNNEMGRLQLYLSGLDQSEEFLIAGSDISSLLTMARKLTLVRGIQPQCLRSIEFILNKFHINSLPQKEQNLILVPFDILEIPKSSETLFERAVKKVLESDLQKYSFGCKLKSTHMRIGSKLHINEFYEAELLFHNNYYVARFAQLIIRRLEHVKKMNKDIPLMFVGYETYSELLLYEIVTNLNERGYTSSYMIYEQRRKGKFRYYESDAYIKSKEELEFILIVPINSSMTTHSKLRASLMVELDNIRSNFQPKIAVNYALILIRSEEENSPCRGIEERYCISIKDGIIQAKLLPEHEREIRYFVCVNTKWNHPLKCKLCFPKQSMLDEQPLIETNKESIIPVQMLGIQEADILNASETEQYDESEKEKYIIERRENMLRVQKLGKSLIYRHIVRKGNHFMFYFQLEKYFMQNRIEIIDWLIKLKKPKIKGEAIIYDVIVAPLHFSNAGFVAEVNYHLYGNAALVLNFEVEKEFRDNVRTKYSNIIGLYKKLVDMGKEAELRFHFVDDNIITGNTFFRAKSLFTSLLPEYLDQKRMVRVRVFEDVIVILNRMSKANIMNCTMDKNAYHAYVSLDISSMRNHEDACILCKIVSNVRMLRDASSTNIMYEFWDKKIVKHRMIDEEEYQQELAEQHDNSMQKRAYKRMLCTHIFNERLSDLGYMKNNTEQVKQVMLELLKEKANSRQKEEAMEWIISYIKIFSRPFVSFRKSSMEASFRIMLELLEFIVNELILSSSVLKKKQFTNYKGLQEVCRVLRDEKMETGKDTRIYVLILTLMQRLSALGSNYIIRKININKLFTVVNRLNIDQEEWQEFKKRYLSIAKRITGLSSDESKCVYLEYLLLYGEEYIDEETEKAMKKKGLPNNFGLQGDIEFLEILFLENTRVLYDGIHDLAGETDTMIQDNILSEKIQNGYYYDNFKRILSYYQFMTVEDEKVQFKDGKQKVICTLVKLYRMLSEEAEYSKEYDVERFYNDLLDYIEIITGAKDVKLLFFYDLANGYEKKQKKVYKKQKGMEISLEEIDYVPETFQYDTYVVCQKNTNRMLIKYKNYTGRGYSAKERRQMDEVYLELTFAKELTEIEKMIALKCVMVFRNLIVVNLEKHFSNNLMQKWSAEQIFKKNMKLERSSDHTDKDDLEKNLKMISNGMQDWNPEYQKALFYLVINSYIARINVQLLADALPEGENIEYPFAFVYRRQLKALIAAMGQFEKFKIIDENGREEFSRKVLQARIRMYHSEKRIERLSVKKLSIIIIELIHSAIKYSDDQRVYIYREREYLVVRNSFISNKPISMIQQEAHDAYSRKKEGISLAVIKELVDKFYMLEKPNDVIIDAKEEDGKKFYYVKLPIFEVERGYNK
ncbi:MAG: hypothetical protein HFI75_12110 [Lachnospiraceae bacterium]|nr:hypothetical protein [Lachnospiraceae bacterium]